MNLTEQIETLKQELREFIALSETITPGRWEAFQRDEEIGTNYCRITFTDRRSDSLHGYCGEPNATFIARSRNISPTMAECLLVAVEYMERDADQYGSGNPRAEGRETRLQQILNIWEATK